MAGKLSLEAFAELLRLRLELLTRGSRVTLRVPTCLMASYDPITDERLSQVTVEQLKDFLGDSKISAVELDACSTKFALIRLAEEKGIALEPCFAAAVAPSSSGDFVTSMTKMVKQGDDQVGSAMKLKKTKVAKKPAKGGKTKKVDGRSSPKSSPSASPPAKRTGTKSAQGSDGSAATGVTRAVLPTAPIEGAAERRQAAAAGDSSAQAKSTKTGKGQTHEAASKTESVIKIASGSNARLDDADATMVTLNLGPFKGETLTMSLAVPVTSSA